MSRTLQSFQEETGADSFFSTSTTEVQESEEWCQTDLDKMYDALLQLGLQEKLLSRSMVSTAMSDCSKYSAYFPNLPFKEQVTLVYERLRNTRI